MDTALIFDIIESTVGLGTLIVSIIVFLTTIRRTEHDRLQNAARERFYSFYRKIDELFKMLDPQKYYDELSTIYSHSLSFSAATKYAEIKHLSSDIHYKIEEIHLHVPDNSESTRIVLDVLKILTEQALLINNRLCNDLKLLNEGKANEINKSQIDLLLKSYQKEYSEIVAFAFRGLHITRDRIMQGKKSSQVKGYEANYKEKYNNK